MMPIQPRHIKELLVQKKTNFPEIWKNDLIVTVVKDLKDKVPLSEYEEMCLEEYVTELVNNYY